MNNQWDADPDKYAEMSKPFASEEEATKVVGAFFDGVRKLREQYRIAELTMQCQVYIETAEGRTKLKLGGGWGSQLEQAKLAKRSADQEINHLLVTIRKLTQALPDNDGTDLAAEMLIAVAERLFEAMPEARQVLITDPMFKR